MHTLSKSSLWGVTLLIAFACTWDQVETQVDCSVSDLSLTLLENSNTTCGASDGRFEVEVSGGVAPYTFSSDAGEGVDGLYANVAAGNYDVTVTDGNGCASTLDVSILNEDGVNLEEVTTAGFGCGSNGGTINVSAIGGTAPYRFSINGGALQTSGGFNGLSTGEHTINVVDENGCETTEVIEVLSGVSYEESIKGIIENSCAISGCHNGSVSPDLRSFETIQARAASIKSRTGNKSMPRGSSLTQSQIDMIACWVDDGALAN